MAGWGLGTSRRDMLRIFEGHSIVGLTEGELLERFVRRGDRTAFEALVTKLGPTVLGVCRRMLDNPHDIDDAFQATFLILVRRSRTLKDPELVGAWLHGVATKVAQRSRSQSLQRARRERLGIVTDPSTNSDTESSVDWPELGAIIDQEIERLPEHQRYPILLCDVEGLSREEAAIRLGWTLNMVRGRLERARQRLRIRLKRRGVAPPDLITPALLGSAGPTHSLLTATTSLATQSTAGWSVVHTIGGSSGALTLAQGMFRTMTLIKIKSGLAALLTSGIVLSGTTIWIAAQSPTHCPAH